MNAFKKVGRYQLGRTLGEGTFSKVKYARNLETGEDVAIKIIDKERIFKHEMIRREISTMKLIKHPNVVQLIEVLADKKKVYIVLEFVNGGELFHKLVVKGKLREDEARSYFQQLIHAVDYCHSRGVYHRDLKPENLLLDSKGYLKISDFGLSALSRQCKEDGLLHTACGTPNYVAPEVISGKGYDGAPADLWSCGVILYVLLAGYLPFEETNIITLYRKINQADYTLPSWFSKRARNLISRLLDPSPTTRITIPEILENEWFKIGDMSITPTARNIGDLDVDVIFDSGEDNFVNQDSSPSLINAFEIISMSQGLDLSGLFDDRKSSLKNDTRFTSKHPAKNIVSRIEDIATSLGFAVRKNNFKMKMQTRKPGRKGCLSVTTEVFEMSPSLFMVEMKQINGDTLEYNDFNKNMRTALKDIVWKTEEDMTSV